MAKKIRLALDRMPNTIHTGIYVAVQKGWYDNAGLELELLLPEEDSNTYNPLKKLEAGLVDLSLTSSECLINYQIKTNNSSLIAIAAVLAKDASAVVTLQQSEIDQPAKLDQHTYASGNAFFEELVVRQMIRQDGGIGNIEVIYPQLPGIWSTLQSGAADAAWIFLPWEGVEARLKGMELHVFQFNDYNIPYGYNPVLLTSVEAIQRDVKALKAFMQATARGYQFAKNAPFEAAQILLTTVPELSSIDSTFVEQSQVFISQYYLDEQGNWGMMQIKVWEAFANWMIQTGILHEISDVPIDTFDAFQLFTNELLT